MADACFQGVHHFGKRLEGYDRNALDGYGSYIHRIN
jgi:hypothetical protein